MKSFFGQDGAGGSRMTLGFSGVDDERLAKSLSLPFEILAWSWGFSAPSEESDGAAKQPGSKDCKGRKADCPPQDISLTKYMTAASPALVQMIGLGKKIKNVTLSISNETEKIEMNFENATVISIAMGGSGGEDQLTENITLNFESMTFHFTHMKEGKEGASSSEKIKFFEK